MVYTKPHLTRNQIGLSHGNGETNFPDCKKLAADPFPASGGGADKQIITTLSIQYPSETTTTIVCVGNILIYTRHRTVPEIKLENVNFSGQPGWRKSVLSEWLIRFARRIYVLSCHNIVSAQIKKIINKLAAKIGKLGNQKRIDGVV